MASAFQYQLGALTAQLGEMCAMAAQAMNDATYALLEADLAVADGVIAGHDETAAMSSSAQETTFLLLSMRAPVATDLSAVVDAVQIAVDAERMGELATKVAKIAGRRHPDHAVPAEATKPIADMGALAVGMAHGAHDALLARDAGMATRVIRDGDAIWQLHRQLVSVLIDKGRENGVAVAVDITLLAGYYQRFADHAVQIVRRVASRGSPVTAYRKRIDLNAG
jgi:phosphate transport system protein